MIQIEKLILYSRDGDIRELPLEKNALNIITGKSKTGKTAIIDIVSYLLGNSKFNIPHGIIRDTVEWYGILYSLNEFQLFVAKPEPKEGKKSQSELFFKIGKDLKIPHLNNLKCNSSDDELIELIDQKMGIEENIHMPKETETRRPLSANLSHTKYYLFQSQSEIANKKMLFHRQNEPFMVQSIKDTMKYFLGITSPILISLINDRRRIKKELTLLEKKLIEVEMFSKNELSLGKKLLEEAKQTGVVDNSVKFEKIEETFSVFEKIAKWTPNSKIVINDDQIPKLQNTIKNLRKEFKNINQEILAVESFDITSEDYKKELFEQEQRLISVKILEDVNDSHCPLCNAQTKDTGDIINSLKKSLSNIDKNLSYVNKDKNKINKYIKSLKEKKSILKNNIMDYESKLQDLIKEESELSKLNSLNAQISRIMGRISLYLETVKISKPDSKLNTDINELKEQLSQLDEKIDELNDEEKFIRAIDKINEKINEYKKDLEIEFSDKTLKFDFKNLTIFFEKKDQKITLNDMGSGENWLAAHIIVLLSFHEYFIEKKRPVPRFIILDQPSQVYFPDMSKYLALEGKEDELDDKEVQSVKNLYSLLKKFIDKHKGLFQIIVFEHANIKEDFYQDALVEDRWDGINNALIPPEWKNKVKEK